MSEPFALYTRPKTRFVAGFIGRTNFIEGICDGEEVLFDHFAIQRHRFEGVLQNFGKIVLFSVRPQSIILHRDPPAGMDSRCIIDGRVVQRAYLGESWDYVVVPAGGALRLRVTASPMQRFQVGERVWLELDPKQMVPIA